MSVRLSFRFKNSAPTGQILWDLFFVNFQKYVEEIRVSLKSEKMTCTLRKDVHTFITCRLIFL
jgi:hypothetical protein